LYARDRSERADGGSPFRPIQAVCIQRVFPGREANIKPAALACDLFQRGVVRYIVLTGGSNRLTGVNEAHAHYRGFSRRSVAQD
jgi:hypothetical protein